MVSVLRTFRTFRSIWPCEIRGDVNRSENMRRIRSTDTAPEMAVRRMAFALGYRYRLHRRDLPGKPDLVFPGKRKIIFVNGCFWHQHHDCNEGRPPKSNRTYWLPKLERTVERDHTALRRLRRSGWSVMVIWECELKRPSVVRRRLQTFLSRVRRA